jgi:4-amino-4-deoxy-L-arabinose transferase-like glycosyltransferase
LTLTILTTLLVEFSLARIFPVDFRLVPAHFAGALAFFAAGIILSLGIFETIHQAGPQRRFPPSILLAGVVLLGLALRLYRIGSQSIWYDEVVWLSVSRLSFGQINAFLIRDLIHPPLHCYALHVWFQAFGFGLLQGRLLSVFFGTLAVLMIYVLARYLFDRRTALLSALLLACSQLAIMCSQDARPYAQFLFFFLACAYLFLRALRGKRLPIWIGFLGLACLLIYTHYYGFLALGALLLFGFAYRKRYPISRVWLLGGAFGLALAYVPWLSIGIVGEALHGQKMERLIAIAHSGRAPAVHWFTFITALNTFNNGRPNGLLESSPWWTFIVGGVLFSLPAAFALRPLVRRQSQATYAESERENLVYLVLLSVVPMALALTAGSLRGWYAVEYVAFCAAPYYILAARGISLQRSAALRWALLAFILAYSARSLRANYFIPYKEDYKDALASVARDYQPRDCAVVAPTWEEQEARWAWSIYESDQPGLHVIPLDSALPAEGECGRVWLISVLYRGHPSSVRESEAARQRLAQTYAEIERRRFFWVDIDLFSAVPAAPR